MRVGKEQQKRNNSVWITEVGEVKCDGKFTAVVRFYDKPQKWAWLRRFRCILAGVNVAGAFETALSREECVTKKIVRTKKIHKRGYSKGNACRARKVLP